MELHDLMIAGLTAIASFIAAIVASAYAASASIVRGDGLLHEWSRRTIFGVGAVALVWAIYFLVGGMIVRLWRG